MGGGGGGKWGGNKRRIEYKKDCVERKMILLYE